MTMRAGSVLLTLSVISITLLASGTAAVAQFRGRMGAGPGGEPMLLLMIRSANLTPEQHAKVRELVATRGAATRSLMQQLQQAEDVLAERLLAPGSVQLTDVQPQLLRITQLREQLLRDSTQAALDIRALLTPEQLARAAQTNSRMQQLQREMRQLWQPGN